MNNRSSGASQSFRNSGGACCSARPLCTRVRCFLASRHKTPSFMPGLLDGMEDLEGCNIGGLGN